MDRMLTGAPRRRFPKGGGTYGIPLRFAFSLLAVLDVDVVEFVDRLETDPPRVSHEEGNQSSRDNGVEGEAGEMPRLRRATDPAIFRRRPPPAGEGRFRPDGQELVGAGDEVFMRAGPRWGANESHRLVPQAAAGVERAVDRGGRNVRSHPGVELRENHDVVAVWDQLRDPQKQTGRARSSQSGIRAAE